MGDTERFVYKRREGLVPLYSLSVLFVARGAVNTNKCLSLIKPVATDKYLSDIMDTPTNSLRCTHFDLESKKKKATHIFFIKEHNRSNKWRFYICVVNAFDDHSLLAIAMWIVADRFYTLRSTEKTLIALCATSRKRRVINVELQYAAVDTCAAGMSCTRAGNQRDSRLINRPISVHFDETLSR